ncbi:hypothetical protein AB4Z40_25430 [Bosea sp. 2YAB26]|uniref:hypothetical protein n=1 Tax=Bosea sp. 2YAB26 TaxID=3237478 RepID=UPI003F9015EE
MSQPAVWFDFHNPPAIRRSELSWRYALGQIGRALHRFRLNFPALGRPIEGASFAWTFFHKDKRWQ